MSQSARCSNYEHNEECIILARLGPLTDNVDRVRTIFYCTHCGVTVCEPIDRTKYRAFTADRIGEVKPLEMKYVRL